MTKVDGLTHKQKALLDKFTSPSSPTYLNATESARGVYNAKDDNSLRSIGGQIVRKCLPRIADQSSLNPVLRGRLTADWILSNISDIALSARRPADKLKALELLGKFRDLNLFKDSSDITVSPSINNQSIDDLTNEYRLLLSSTSLLLSSTSEDR